MSSADFYREQAAKDRTLAEQTALPSVRERCERSAAAWVVMAERIESTEAQRAARLASKNAA